MVQENLQDRVLILKSKFHFWDSWDSLNTDSMLGDIIELMLIFIGVIMLLWVNRRMPLFLEAISWCIQKMSVTIPAVLDTLQRFGGEINIY